MVKRSLLLIQEIYGQKFQTLVSSATSPSRFSKESMQTTCLSNRGPGWYFVGSGRRSQKTTLKHFLLFFALVCWLDLECRQVYVDSAFPYADLEEEICIKPPPVAYVRPGMVLRLWKALCGFKQAPRAWFKLVIEILSEIGYVRCQTDHCLFTLFK
jgi:Reverse transcriptase (RNA-dependent DNA polymerase)